MSGYSLEHLLPENGRSVDQFLAGSEGTLAVVREATVRLVEDEPHRQLLVFGYATMVEAADAVPALLEAGAGRLVACEGLDSRIVELVRARGTAVPRLPKGDGWLFCEMAGSDLDEIRDALSRLVPASGCVEGLLVDDDAHAAALWRIREDGAGLAARSLATPAYSGWEDAAVPPDRLGAWLRDFDELLREHDLDGVPYGHFGDGCVHVRIDFPFRPGSDATTKVFRDFLTACALKLRDHRGSLSGEHGDGRARSELLPLMYDAESLRLFAAVKAICDPGNLLNPGNLVDPRSVRRRPATGAAAAAGHTAAPAAARRRQPRRRRAPLHGCREVRGARDHRGDVPVLPRDPRREGLHPRPRPGAPGGHRRLAGARLRRPGGGRGTGPVPGLQGLCLGLPDRGGHGDVQGRGAAPEARRGGVRRPRSHRMLGRLPWWADLAAPMAPVANRMAAAEAGRAAGQGRPPASTSGARSRRSPRRPCGSRRPDRWRAGRVDLGRLVQRPLLPGNGHAAIRYLESVGRTARVIPDDACCGLTLVSTGQLDRARTLMEQTVATLRPYVESGVPVIGLEPSCLATLRSDAVELTGDVLDVLSLAELLTRLDLPLPDLTGVEVVAQPHCHQHAVIGWAADQALLERAGATVTRVAGCCGLAGNFGMEKGHYEVSVAVAETHLLPAVRGNPAAVVLADGMSCRVQLEDLTASRPCTWPSCWPGGFSAGLRHEVDRVYWSRLRLAPPT